MKIIEIATGKEVENEDVYVNSKGNIIELINHNEYGYEPRNVSDKYCIVSDVRSREEIIEKNICLSEELQHWMNTFEKVKREVELEPLKYLVKVIKESE